VGAALTNKIIYLTGAPATGKSTLTENLSQQLPDAVVFTYSKELLDWVQRRAKLIATQDDLRRESAKMITREDVQAVDSQLIELANSCRGRQTMVVDSHPVTIEEFGFRVTPFTKKQLCALVPDVIVCLYANAETIIERISKNAAGRPMPSRYEIDLHTQLQCQVASIYAIETGASLYYLNASCSPDDLLSNFVSVTGIGSPKNKK
jgi:adenylate kinase